MSKKKFINGTHLEGYVYDHALTLKTVTNQDSKNFGTEFINGKLSIATDAELLNVVDVYFTYVTATTKNGGANATFNLLMSLIEGKAGTVMANGKDNALKVRIDSAIALNEWYNFKEEGAPLVSTKRNVGGFVHQTSEFDPDPAKHSTFELDMVITSVIRKEADPEKEIPEREIVKGYIFDFRGAVMPVEFTVMEDGIAPEGALDYFENLGASSKSPVFTKVQGQQISRTIVRRKEEPSAFGAPIIKETRTTQKDMVITWASPETYDWDNEDTILASELAEKLAEREVYLATEKKRQEDYQKNKGNAITASKTNAAAPAASDYNF